MLCTSCSASQPCGILHPSPSMAARWNLLNLFYLQPLLQDPLEFSTYVCSVGLCPFPTMAGHQLNLHPTVWNDFGCRLLEEAFWGWWMWMCLFSELLPSGWQLKSKLFMAFSLFQATKELELDKLGTSQHRFALCKDIMKSLNLPTVLVEVRWQRAECVYQGINVLNLKLSSKYKIYSH